MAGEAVLEARTGAGLPGAGRASAGVAAGHPALRVRAQVNDPARAGSGELDGRVAGI